eukprot:3466066-Pleurochrysis_carterae.AAC.1
MTSPANLIPPTLPFVFAPPSFPILSSAPQAPPSSPASVVPATPPLPCYPPGLSANETAYTLYDLNLVCEQDPYELNGTQYDLETPPGGWTDALWQAELNNAAAVCADTQGCAYFEMSRSTDSTDTWATAAFFTSCQDSGIDTANGTLYESTVYALISQLPACAVSLPGPGAASYVSLPYTGSGDTGSGFASFPATGSSSPVSLPTTASTPMASSFSRTSLATPVPSLTITSLPATSFAVISSVATPTSLSSVPVTPFSFPITTSFPATASLPTIISVPAMTSFVGATSFPITTS